LGNRAGTAVFPNLTYLAIRLEPAILPQDYGWLMPTLRRLRLLHITQSSLQVEQDQEAEIEMCLPSSIALQPWIDISSPASYSKRMLENSPELESITVALASTAGQSQESFDWIQLAPPCPVAWEIHRLLLLAVRKPHGACAMSALTIDLVANILNFMGTPSWQRSFFKLLPDQMAQLGLPEDFENEALVGLL
jgi:hypothetical protein